MGSLYCGLLKILFHRSINSLEIVIILQLSFCYSFNSCVWDNKINLYIVFSLNVV